VNTLGQRLKNLRKEKEGQPTQKQVADVIGYTRDTYANWENDRGEPPNDALRGLASYYNVTTDYLLGRTDDKRKLSADNYLDHLTAEEKEFVIKEKMWIKLAAECAGQGLSVDKVRELIHTAMHFK
jgi:transcriptional regulator with XRE-family HTH domain